MLKFRQKNTKKGLMYACINNKTSQEEFFDTSTKIRQ